MPPEAQEQTPTSPLAGQAAAAQPVTSQAGAAPEKETVPAKEAEKAAMTAPVRPDWLPETHWDATAGFKADAIKADYDRLNQLAAFKAEADIRLQGVPEKPDGYKIALDGFEAPEGVSVAIDENHPMAGPAKSFAHKWQLPQEAMNELVKMQAGYVVETAKSFNEEMKAERVKLGDKADARIAAVETALVGRLGETGKALSGLLVSAAAVEGFEALLRTTAAAGPGVVNGSAKPVVDMSGMSPTAKFAAILSRTSGTAAGRRN